MEDNNRPDFQYTCKQLNGAQAKALETKLAVQKLESEISWKQNELRARQAEQAAYEREADFIGKYYTKQLRKVIKSLSGPQLHREQVLYPELEAEFNHMVEELVELTGITPQEATEILER